MIVTVAEALRLPYTEQLDWARAADHGGRVVRVEITTDPAEAGLCASCGHDLDGDGPECGYCDAEGDL